MIWIQKYINIVLYFPIKPIKQNKIWFAYKKYIFINIQYTFTYTYEYVLCNMCNITHIF